MLLKANVVLGVVVQVINIRVGNDFCSCSDVPVSCMMEQRDRL